MQQRDLGAIVKGAPVMKRLRARYGAAGFGQCKGCAVRPWCAGDCRGEVNALTGDPGAVSPHCEEPKKVIVKMLWLEAQGEESQ